MHMYNLRNYASAVWFVQGGFFACFQHLWAVWAPTSELGMLTTFQAAGNARLTWFT